MRSRERAARHSGPLSDLSLPAVQLWHAERRRYFDLVHKKRSAFWTACINAERSQPCHLWQSFDQLLGRGCGPEADIDATVLHRFFDDKVASVRAATAGDAAPQFTTVPLAVNSVFSHLSVTIDDVVKMVRALPGKQCSSDPLPTWLLKENIDALAPFFTHLICWSLQHGIVPSRMKSAYIMPRLKKADLDPTDAKSYRLYPTCPCCPSC